MLVTLYVDGDSPINAHVKTHNAVEEGELTEVALIPLDINATKTLDSLYEDGKTYVEGRVYSYVAGYVSALTLASH